MKTLLKFWKVLLAVILLAAAAFLYFNNYKIEEAAHEAKTRQMETMILALKSSIAENEKYKDIQGDLEAATAQVEASRQELYKHFPVGMKEEDQIMYVLYLETLFKEEIFFEFSQPMELVPLQDGSSLQGLLLTVNYRTTYKGFQEMVSYLATDSRIASVYEATIAYDAESDTAVGAVSIILYLIDSPDRAYTAPDIAVPDTGKNNIFAGPDSEATGSGASKSGAYGAQTKVWIPDDGDCYHSNSRCSGMNSPRQATLEQAKKLGLRACSNCY